MSNAGNGFVPKENISKNKQTPPVSLSPSSVPLSLPLLPSSQHRQQPPQHSPTPHPSSIVCLAVAL